MTFWLRHKKVNVSADVCCSRELPWKIFFFHDVNFNYKQGLLASVYRLYITKHDVGLSRKKMGMNFSYYVNEHKLQCEEKSPFFQKRTMVPLFLQDLPKTHTYVFILPRLWQWSHQTKISPTTNRTKMWKAPYWFNHLYMLTRIKGWR